jgi:hypothetical protein
MRIRIDDILIRREAYLFKAGLRVSNGENTPDLKLNPARKSQTATLAGIASGTTPAEATYFACQDISARHSCAQWRKDPVRVTQSEWHIHVGTLLLRKGK